jgi:hypothetical protein
MMVVNVFPVEPFRHRNECHRYRQIITNPEPTARRRVMSGPLSIPAPKSRLRVDGSGDA